MKTYVINMPGSAERRKSIARELGRFNLEFEFFPAVDGKAMPDAEMRGSMHEPELNPLCKAEIGCTLSHLGIYRDMIDRDIPVAMILEDDSVLNLDPAPLLSGLERRPADVPDVYLLTHRSNRYEARRPLPVSGVRFYPGWNAVGGNGYVITRAAAAKLLAFQTPVRLMCDGWKMFLYYDLIRLWVCEREFVGLHPELGDVSVSLLEGGRLSGDVPRKKLYYRRLRRRTPLGSRVKYYLRKIGCWSRLKYQ